MSSAEPYPSQSPISQIAAEVIQFRRGQELSAAQGLATLELIRDIVDTTLPGIDPSETHDRNRASVTTIEHPIVMNPIKADNWTPMDATYAKLVQCNVAWLEGAGEDETVELMPHVVIGATKDRRVEGFTHLLVAPLGRDKAIAARWGCRVLTFTDSMVTARIRREQRLMRIPFSPTQQERMTDERGRIVIDTSLTEAMIMVAAETDDYPNSNVITYVKGDALDGVSTSTFDRFNVARTLAQLVDTFGGHEEIRLLERKRLGGSSGLDQESAHDAEKGFSYTTLLDAYDALRSNHERALGMIIRYTMRAHGLTFEEAKAGVSSRFPQPRRFK